MEDEAKDKWLKKYTALHDENIKKLYENQLMNDNTMDHHIFKVGIERLTGESYDKILDKLYGGSSWRGTHISAFPGVFNSKVGKEMVDKTKEVEDALPIIADWYLLPEKEFRVKYAMKDVGIL